MRVRSLRFGVIGTGLIGGSLLRRLTAAGTDAVGWDPAPAAMEQAAAMGVRLTEHLADAVTDRDIVFLATPLSTLPQIISQVAAHVAADAVVTDVGSTKTDVAATASASPLADRFIPGHPMAGSEKSGLTAADVDLFDGATWVLCPADSVQLHRVRLLITVITTILNAQVTVMTATEHDEAVALSSHIPHILAGALAGSVDRGPAGNAVLNLAAGSFRDGTRVAGTTPQRTVDMLIHNADAVTGRFREVQRLLAEMTAAVADRDAAGLTELFAAARRVRHRLVEGDGHRAVREFTDAAAERRFLAAMGSRGACVTGCSISGDRASYSLVEPFSEA